ncbi:Rieske 2Fe-2S domain-containing protein [Bacillus massilinigeriensis]|uniref:Rieske 2Fe-2S domain-containing protein n=1 Tax=Bacillus mediterraneensis TaxID=1805474 RepID=UPI0008F9663A|nr:Rieske 2Fe-2S domain-containing protein [Bacillus mediterraneensis]
MPKENKNNNHHDDKDMMKLVDNLNRKEDASLNRRAFLKASFGATVAIGIASAPFSALSYFKGDGENDHLVEIANVDELGVGESKTFSYPTSENPAILVRTPDDRFVAYNNKCTHLQCPVFYEVKENILLCPCHKGYFDVANGHPMAGPPQRELPKILLEVKNGKIFAIGREVRHG